MARVSTGVVAKAQERELGLMGEHSDALACETGSGLVRVDLFRVSVIAAFRNRPCWRALYQPDGSAVSGAEAAVSN